MKPAMKKKLLEAMTAELTDLLADNFHLVFSRFETMHSQAQDGRTKYQVPLRLTVAADGVNLKVMGDFRGELADCAEESLGRVVTPNPEQFEDRI